MYPQHMDPQITISTDPMSSIQSTPLSTWATTLYEFTPEDVEPDPNWETQAPKEQNLGEENLEAQRSEAQRLEAKRLKARKILDEFLKTRTLPKEELTVHTSKIQKLEEAIEDLTAEIPEEQLLATQQVTADTPENQKPEDDTKEILEAYDLEKEEAACLSEISSTEFPICSEDNDNNAAELASDLDNCRLWFKPGQEVSWSEDINWRTKRLYPGYRRVQRWREKRASEDKNRNLHIVNSQQTWGHDEEERLLLKAKYTRIVKEIPSRNEKYPYIATKYESFRKKLESLPNDEWDDSDGSDLTSTSANSVGSISDKLLDSLIRWCAKLNTDDGCPLVVSDSGLFLATAAIPNL